MPKGHVDWNIDTNAVVTISNETNELAVRLGSNNRLADSGQLFYETSFVSDLALWKATVNAAGCRLILDRRNGVFDKGCLLIFNGVAADRNITLKRRLPRVVSSKYGLESIFCFLQNDALYRMNFVLNDGVNDTIFGVEINSADDDVKLLDSDGNYDSVQTLTITPILTENKWIYVKIIVNIDTGTYEKLIINNVEIDTIVQTPDINVAADLPKSEIQLFADNTGATAFRILVATCILTISEP